MPLSDRAIYHGNKTSVSKKFREAFDCLRDGLFLCFSIIHFVHCPVYTIKNTTTYHDVSEKGYLSVLR
jgi:hypothetical protein